MEDLKKKVEALLFSSARRMSLEEIAKLCRHSPEQIKEVLLLLQKEYDEKQGSLMVVDEGEYWKLTTREEYLNLVKNIVTQTELSKTLMETLAVIAFKYPIKQADLIKIRTNKAYDHLKELEELGYITRQKFGRTKLIKLSQKFFDYFSLPEDKLKEQFQDFEGLADAINSKEEEIKKIKAEQKKKAKDAGKKDKEVDLVDDDGNKVKLEVVDEPEVSDNSEEDKPKIETYNDNVQGLEVVDLPENEVKEEQGNGHKSQSDLTSQEEKTPEEVQVQEQFEEKVDEKVNEILGLGEIDSNGAEKPTENENSSEDKKEEEKEELSDVDKKVGELLKPKEEESQHMHDMDKDKWGQEKEEESHKSQSDLTSQDKPDDFVDSAFTNGENKEDSTDDSSDSSEELNIGQDISTGVEDSDNNESNSEEEKQE